MTESALRQVDLRKYAPLVRMACGEQSAWVVCDADGHVVWGDGNGLQPQLRANLATLARDGFADDAVATTPLLLRRIRTSEEELGWLAILSSSPDVESRAGHLDALDSVAACVRDECAANAELDGLAYELEQRNEELNLVYSLDQLAQPDIDPNGRLRALLTKVSRSMDADLAVFFGESWTTPTVGINPQRELPSLDLLKIELGGSGSLYRFVCSKREGLVLNRLEEPRRRFLVPHLPFKLLVCPAGDQGEIDGMLVLARRLEGRDFLAGDMHLATVIADHIGVTLRSQESISRVREFGDQMAGALIEAVEAKDPYTAGHSSRVQAVSVHIGREMGLRRGDLESLFWGSIMHDIGKIGIPDVILSKPGRLTEDEFAFVKTHPIRSYEILRHIAHFDTNALDAAHYHHEKFDGTGYPSGLAGEEISIFARIVAVADMYDAITSSRSYRAAGTHERAVEKIREVVGQQLDPQVVRAFDAACSGDPALRDFIWSLSSKADA